MSIRIGRLQANSGYEIRSSWGRDPARPRGGVASGGRGFTLRGRRRNAAFRNATELAGGTEIYALPEGLIGESGLHRMAPGALSADDRLGLALRRSGHMRRRVANRSNRKLYKIEHSSALRYRLQRADLILLDRSPANVLRVAAGSLPTPRAADHGPDQG